MKKKPVIQLSPTARLQLEIAKLIETEVALIGLAYDKSDILAINEFYVPNQLVREDHFELDMQNVSEWFMDLYEMGYDRTQYARVIAHTHPSGVRDFSTDDLNNIREFFAGAKFAAALIAVKGGGYSGMVQITHDIYAAHIKCDVKEDLFLPGPLEFDATKYLEAIKEACVKDTKLNWYSADNLGRPGQDTGVFWRFARGKWQVKGGMYRGYPHTSYYCQAPGCRALISVNDRMQKCKEQTCSYPICEECYDKGIVYCWHCAGQAETKAIVGGVQ